MGLAIGINTNKPIVRAVGSDVQDSDLSALSGPSLNTQTRSSFLRNSRDRGESGYTSSNSPARTISFKAGVNTPWAHRATTVRPAIAAFVDMDGVLANQPLFHERVAQTFLKKHGIESNIADLHMLKRRGYDLWTIAINRLRSTKGVTQSQTPDVILKDQLRSIEANEHRLERDACIVDRGLLREFNSVIFVIIATNRDGESTWSFLVDHGLEDCISFAYHRNMESTTSAAGYGLTKPHPDMLFRARQDLGLGKSAQYYMFGDQPSDMMLARNAMRGDPNDHSMIDRVTQDGPMKVTSFGVLPPGHHSDATMESVLFRHGAKAVRPSLNDFMREFLQQLT